nr:2-(3-amino-3-carboxypropyl)histidine synthase subunit 2-like [Lytechinus pictus]
MSTSTFFTDALAVIQRTVDVNINAVESQDIEEQYQVDRCVQFINNGNYKKVGLQFPDDLLHLSSRLAGILQSKTSATVFILGDTSYGSCCVDEVAAEHAGADAIIHYGPACLSPTKRFPILYVFGQGKIDVDKCSESFRSLIADRSKHVLSLSDVIYSHAIDELQARLEEDYPNAVFAKIDSPESIPSQDESQMDFSQSGLNCECTSGTCCSKGQGNIQPKVQTSPIKSREGAEDGQNDERSQEQDDLTYRESVLKEPSQTQFFGRTFDLKGSTRLEDFVVFYVGAEGRTLTNFMMVLNKCTFFTFDPATCRGRQETLNVSRTLMRRYHLIEKAKDANVVGILAGTLGVASYLDIITHLKKLLKNAGKKSYVFAVGKLNVPKLANFMEVDAYVLVACPENSLVDSKEFYRPVVTPFEMEIACNEAREWTGEYITDFQTLVPGSSKHVEIATPTDTTDRTDVSLITGKLRSLGNRDDSTLTKDAKTLVSKEETLTISNVHKNASEFLIGRSWQGLEQKLGETPVVMATEGRKGIAAGYTHEET